MEFSGYEDGYSVGWEEGRELGYCEGVSETTTMYEQRLSALWAELYSLNARIDYLEGQLK